MFSYYGSKSKIVDYYPPPKYKRIIEPFAGSARYSLKFWDNDILLIDLSESVINAWVYLKQASEKDILGLPNIFEGCDLRDFNITETERFIIYCCCTGGGAGTGQGYKITASKNTGFNSWNKDKKRISENLFKIKHWNFKLGSYKDLPNEKCTWFIDPPYKFGGHKYKFSNKLIDFDDLSNWSKEREGQVIVCENTKADWMNFKPMTEMQGVKFRTTEAIWCNMPTNYDYQQQSLF